MEAAILHVEEEKLSNKIFLYVTMIFFFFFRRLG